MAMWSGYITFGLVSIPVELHAALESSERVSFRLLHKRDLAPIKYKKICSAENIEVKNNEIVKGYEVEKNRFAVLEQEELEKVQQKVGEGDRSIEILKFVELASINPLLYERPYYLAPQKEGKEPYAVLREALRDARRVGIARFYLRTKPILAALIPGPKALSLAALRPFEELRDPEDLPLPGHAKKPAEVKMARMLIDQMADEWDPTEHPNEYRQALQRLLATKRKFSLKEAKSKPPAKVIDLTEALRKSVRGSRRRSGRAAAQRAGAA